MNNLKSLKMLAYIISLIAAGFMVLFVLGNFVIYSDAQTSGAGPSDLKFNPPHPEDAPADIKDNVMMGYNILMDTPKNAPAYVSGNMSCSNCHAKAGLDENALPLVGVAAVFPKYKKRANATVDLITQTNNCIQGALKGKPLPADSKEMIAILTYYQWISKGIPIYENVPWLGKKAGN